MKKILLLTSLLCLNIIVFAQVTYDENFGSNNNDEFLNSLGVTKNESILIAGTTRPAGGGQSNIYTALLNKSGNLILSRIYNAQLSVSNIQSTTTSDNGVLLFGKLTNTDNSSAGALILRGDKNGNIIWSKQIKNEHYPFLFPVGITEDSSGGFVIAFDEKNSDSTIVSVVHFNANAKKTWQTSVNVRRDPSLSYNSTLLIPTSNGGFAVGGNYFRNNEFYSLTWATLLQLNNKGNVSGFKNISSTRDHGFQDYEVSRLEGLIERNNKYTITGTYYAESSNYYSVTVDSHSDTVQSDLIAFDNFSLQYYAQNNNGYGKPVMANRLYLFKDGGLLRVANGLHGNILVQKYDSLGRICPSYQTPVINTNITHLAFKVNDVVYGVIVNDLSIADINVTGTTVSEQHIICTGIAAVTAITSSVIQQQNIKPVIILYPNPAKNFLVVNFNVVSAASVHIDITSMRGEIVQSQKEILATGKYQRRLDIQTIPKGMYFAKITIGEKQSIIKFIKE